MKKIILMLISALMAIPLAAQTPNPTIPTSRRGDAWPRMISGESRCVDLTGATDPSGYADPFDDHTFTFHPHGSPSALTITITGSTGGAQSSITTSTNTAGAKLHFTGVYSTVCVTATSITGTGAYVDASYIGQAQGSTYTADGGSVATGSTTDAKCTTTDTTACTLVALSKAVSANTATIAAAVNPVSTGCAITSAASTNSTSCKASSGYRTGWWVVNTTATLYYLRLYNTASAPTCSSATGFVISVPIPASTTGAGITFSVPNTVAFATGLGYCLTGGSSSTDNTNAATGVFGEIFYN